MSERLASLQLGFYTLVGIPRSGAQAERGEPSTANFIDFAKPGSTLRVEVAEDEYVVTSTVDATWCARVPKGLAVAVYHRPSVLSPPAAAHSRKGRSLRRGK